MDVLISLVNETNCRFYIESIKKRFFKALYLTLRWEKSMGSMYFAETKHKIGDDLALPFWVNSKGIMNIILLFLHALWNYF